MFKFDLFKVLNISDYILSLYLFKYPITVQLILYLMRCVSPHCSEKSVIHLFTLQFVGPCDDNRLIHRSITNFILHSMTSFLQYSFGELTTVQVSTGYCVYDHICLRGYKNKDGK